MHSLQRSQSMFIHEYCLSQLQVTFSDAIDERLISCREAGLAQDYYKSPDLSSKQLQQKMFLAKAASQLRAQLQVFYRCGKGLKLKKSDIDDHVLRYCFDGLGGKFVLVACKSFHYHTARFHVIKS